MPRNNEFNFVNPSIKGNSNASYPEGTTVFETKC